MEDPTDTIDLRYYVFSVTLVTDHVRVPSVTDHY